MEGADHRPGWRPARTGAHPRAAFPTALVQQRAQPGFLMLWMLEGASGRRAAFERAVFSLE